MKIFILLFSIILASISCGNNNDFSGTVVDVNSGSISGFLLLGNYSYKDSAEVYLYNKENNTLVATDTTIMGTYSFESLSAGTYSLYTGLFNGALKFSAPTEVEIFVNSNSVKDIAIHPLMYRDFELIPTNSQTITVDSFSLEFGYIKNNSQTKNCYTLLFTALNPSNTFSIFHKVDGVDKFVNMYLDVFALKTFELSSSSNNFKVKNYPLITKTGIPSDSSLIKFYFRKTPNTFSNLNTTSKVIFSGDIIDTVYRKFSITDSSLEFSYSRSFNAEDSIHLALEIYDTLAHNLILTGDVGLRVIKNAVMALPIELNTQ